MPLSGIGNQELRICLCSAGRQASLPLPSTLAFCPQPFRIGPLAASAAPKRDCFSLRGFAAATKNAFSLFFSPRRRRVLGISQPHPQKGQTSGGKGILQRRPSAAVAKSPTSLPLPAAEECPCERNEAGEREGHPSLALRAGCRGPRPEVPRPVGPRSEPSAPRPSGRGDFLTPWGSPEAKGGARER